MTPVINLQDCSFNKDTGRLTLSSEFFGGSFPAELVISSHHTGKGVMFVQDNTAAERNEWWDGEMYEYLPIESTNNCFGLTIHHTY